MKARVTEVLSASGSAAVVRLETSAGTAELRAHAQNSSVLTQTACTVELAVNELLEVGRNARAARTHQFDLKSRDGRIFMTGLVDSIDPDGVLYFRLAPDSLTMIEAAFGDFHVGSWISIEVDSSRVVAYLS